jgi:hypothetical protein
MPDKRCLQLAFLFITPELQNWGFTRNRFLVYR